MPSFKQLKIDFASLAPPGLPWRRLFFEKGNNIMKALSTLNRIVENVCAVFAVVMTALVLYQVLARNVLHLSLSVVEEVSRYCMVWLGLLGATIGYRTKSHVAVTYLVDKLPEGARKIVEVIINLLVIAFCLILLIYGWEMISRTIQKSTSMPWLPVKYIMAVVPLCGLISIVYSIENIYKVFKLDK